MAIFASDSIEIVAAPSNGPSVEVVVVAEVFAVFVVFERFAVSGNLRTRSYAPSFESRASLCAFDMHCRAVFPHAHESTV